MTDPTLQEMAIEYAELSKIALDLDTPLGKGQDGCVWKSSRKTAVKVLERQRNYRIELECYQRFKENNVIRIQGFSVPKLRGFNDRLRVIEMGIVSAPFILDFAKAWLDGPAGYSEEVLADRDQKGREEFGEKWDEVESLAWALRQYGIYYYDTSPGNIKFSEDC